MEQNKENKANFWWVISILAVVIIILLTAIIVKVDFCEMPIMRYLNFLSTILAIVLSIFSIAFSYQSMTSSSKIWADIEGAVNKIEQIHEDISDHNNTLLSHVLTIATNIGKLEEKWDGVRPVDQDGKNNEQGNKSIPDTTQNS